MIDGQRWLADSMARCLRPEHVHLIVDQALLPHLHLRGVLGGRSYDVLAVALPMREIEHRLDEAAGQSIHPDAARATLLDFRIESSLADAEISAMHHADRVITPHAEVMAYWRGRGVTVKRLDWVEPPSSSWRSARAESTQRPIVVLPASALARKGAYVLAAALRGLPVRLRVLGSRSGDASLFNGLDVEYRSFGNNAFADAVLVVLPAYVEHAPRGLLAARAQGIRIVATPACGVAGGAGVEIVPAGDVKALRNAVIGAVGVPDRGAGRMLTR